MTPTVRHILHRALLIWGAISLVATLGFAIFAAVTARHLFAHSKSNTNEPVTVTAPRDVLELCSLSEDRFQKVLQQYTSDHPPADLRHVEACQIQLSSVDPNELTAPWHRGDQLPKVIDDAIPMVAGLHHEMPWFPDETELRSQDFSVFPRSLNYEYGRFTGVELIFIRLSDKTVFYFDGF